VAGMVNAIEEQRPLRRRGHRHLSRMHSTEKNGGRKLVVSDARGVTAVLLLRSRRIVLAPVSMFANELTSAILRLTTISYGLGDHVSSAMRRMPSKEAKDKTGISCTLICRR